MTEQKLINEIWNSINVLELNNNSQEINSLIIRAKIVIHNNDYNQLYRCNVRLKSEVKLINVQCPDVKKHTE